jgi:predicted porin
MYYGFQLGVTYIPDTDQYGTVSRAKTVSKTATSTFPSQVYGYKNVFSGGLHYQGKSKKLGFKFSALGEIGEAKDDITDAASDIIIRRHDLRAFELGAAFNFMGFSVNGSYGDWDKSGLAKSVTVGATTTAVTGAKDGRYWSVGVAMDHKNLGFSANYLDSKNGGFISSEITDGTTGYEGEGHASIISVGLQYDMAPGFMPYAEYTHSELKDKSTVTNSKNEGNLFLAGTKLTF